MILTLTIATTIEHAVNKILISNHTMVQVACATSNMVLLFVRAHVLESIGKLHPASNLIWTANRLAIN